jgi:23S rRNA (cytidine1920-2'-O)/16S rRNA (cytidine1409-2'-O)-methyltransferase
MADSRAAAASLIATGRVTVRGAPADKPARLVDASDAVVVVGEPDRYVGRGGHKLAAALDEFGVDPTGWRVLDAGASTGGFTDCLLQHGAAQVIAVDVGHGQIHERLRSDPRVVVRERQNIRSIEVDDLDGPVDAAVVDLSFISLDKVLGAIAGVVRTGGDLIALVKPQFEAGRQEVSKGRGVISDPTVWRRVLREVMDASRGHGAAIMGVMVSPLRGADGNVEFLLHARFGADPADDHDIDVDALVSAIERDGEQD